MSVPPAVVWPVGIVGPPGVGKSALIHRLAMNPRHRVFRLRELACPADLAATATLGDREGWMPDTVVRPLLMGFLRGAFADELTDVVLLDNFPGRASQVAMLVNLLRAAGGGPGRLAVVELQADQPTLRERARARLVCASCERDVLDDPRLPASEAAPRSGVCARCGCRLRPRSGDSPDIFDVRLRRYERHAARLHGACRILGVPVVAIDAAQPASAVVGAVQTQLTSQLMRGQCR